MRSFFKTFLYLLVLFAFENSSYSITEKEINEICKNESRKSICKKNLRSKRLDLIRGNRIEIPVIPFKKNK